MFAKLFNQVKTYGSIFLLVVIAFTLFPFEALHLHAAHEHAYAKHKHLTQHHCELDELVCEQNPDVACEHAHHISTPKHKCFSCSYHFTKNYTLISALTFKPFFFQHQLADGYLSLSLLKALTRISNKGPPVQYLAV